MKGKNRQQVTSSQARSKAAQDTEMRLVKLFQAGKFDAMEREARSILQKSPGNLFGLKALASAKLGAEAYEEAHALLLQLTERTPNDWSAWTNLGAAERGLGNFQEAIEAYEKGLAIDASDATICSDLAHLCRFVNDHQRALKWFFEALKANPDSTDYFLEWVTTLERLRLHEEAIGSLKAAWDSESDNAQLAVTTMIVAKALAEWDLEADVSRFLQTRFRSGLPSNMPPLHLMAIEGLGRREQREAMAALLSNIDEKDYKLKYPLCRPGIKPSVGNRHARLRIGYLSADFHTHATTVLIAGVLEAHAKHGLDMYLYSYGPDDGSAMRKRICEMATVFRDFRCHDDKYVIAQILEDEIDILVDLKGWTMDFRVAIQGMRPAPIVATWLGFPGTIGHELFADYIISDPVVTPLEHADGYTEALALMPHCYQPNDSKREVGKVPTRADVGLPEQDFVFCSFNRFDKVTRRMFTTWCEILQAVPNSVLWLWSDSEYAQRNVLHAAKELGVDSARFIVAPRADLPAHLARLSLADLALDSFPYTSHTTGSDAMWAGVPLLALQGDSFASRVSSSLVTAAGIPEMIVHSLDEYKQKAIELAQSPTKLRDIRNKLREGRLTCPLFDSDGFTRDLARLYQKMWGNYQNGVKVPIVLDSVDDSRHST